MAHLSNIEGIEMEGKLPEVRLASTPFKVVSPYEPAGDQPQAIEKLATGVKEGLRYQNLLGLSLIHIFCVCYKTFPGVLTVAAVTQHQVKAWDHRSVTDATRDFQGGRCICLTQGRRAS